MSFIHSFSVLAKNFKNISHDLHSNDSLTLAVFYQIEIVYIILNIVYTYLQYLHPTNKYICTYVNKPVAS